MVRRHSCRIVAALMLAIVPASMAGAQDDRSERGRIEAKVAPALSALSAGKADDAVRMLTSELNQSTSDPVAIAIISHYRGLAQARAGRPMQAIADFNQALYRKRLPADLARDALTARGQAYSAVGLTDRARSDIEAASEVAQQDAGSAATAALGPDANPAPENGWTPAVAAQQEAIAAAAPPSPAPLPWDTGNQPVQSSPSVASHTPSLGLAGDSVSVTSVPGVSSEQPSLGGFLSALFGGTAQTAQASAQTSPSATASIEPLQPAIGNGWSTTAESAPPGAAAVSNGSAGFVLRLATVRSTSEAKAIVDRLHNEHADLVGPHRLEINPVTLGNMGAFYAVTVGPFAALEESQSQCDRFARAGYDCLAVEP